MIQEAAAFAAEAHRGMVRKGSQIPYIVHPLEVGLLTARMVQDEEVIAAAYLHDVLEDTSVTAEELERRFGPRVLALVLEETEDKRGTWDQRKSATVRHLKQASREVRLLALADKLSNLRSTAADYLAIGDRVWERFHEKRKSCHQWYYRGIIDALEEFSGCPEYEELKDLYKFVFGG